MNLITGATGLVGSHLTLHLVENGESVRALYRSQEGLEKTKALFTLYNKSELFPKIEWIQGDITDISSLEMAFDTIENVYHCAAIISFDPTEENKIRKINIEGTANIVNFSIANRIKKLCYISSIAALGEKKLGEKTISETNEWNPEKAHSDYAISKYGAEMEVWRGRQEGLQVVILNPGIILGPGFWNQGSGVIFNTTVGDFRLYTKGTTGYVAVNDVVKIAHLLMKKDCNGERFVIVSENLSFKKVQHLISVALLEKRPPIFIAKWVCKIACRLDWILNAFFFQKRRLSGAGVKALHGKNTFSNTKIIEFIDYKFQGIEPAIAEIVALSNSK